MAPPLEKFLLETPVRDGIYQISPPRPFQHAEEEYDSTRQDQLSAATIERQGTAIIGFFQSHGYQPGGAILEIGCGSGLSSVALAARPEIGHFLVTDPSPAFCRITQQKLANARRNAARIDCAVLLAEEVDRIPAGAVSVIFLRSVLHHITDVDDFLARCARVLPPGGLLVCEEPYYEGYLMMGFLGQFIAGAVAESGSPCTPEELQHIDRFVETMQFYCRRDVDKTIAEDKHLFRPDDLLVSGRSLGLDLTHFPNWYITGLPEANVENRIGHFERFFASYIRRCMQWPAALCDRVEPAMKRYFRFFEPLETTAHTTPYCFGTFVFNKRR